MSIFRAYDIRGVYTEDLTTEIAEKIGRAFASYIGAGKVAVGRDARLSSPALRDALVKGLLSAGCDVIDVGMVPTPALYFAQRHFNTDGAVMITGSHNGPKYNGFKLCKGTATLYGPQIQEIKGIIDACKFQTGNGKLEEIDIKPEYMEAVKKAVKINKKIKIVVDGGNGAGGLIAAKVLRDLGCDVVELFCEPDGNFPNHFPDPTVDANVKTLREKVLSEKADLGIGFDGDADRLGVIDDQGRIVRGDQSLILFARKTLAEKKGGHIIFEVKCSQAVPEEIEKAGGVPIMYRTGHSFIKKKMKEENSPLAGEMSGHFFFADRFFGFDDGIYAGCRMAEIVAEKKLSETIDELPKYHSTPEIRLHVPETEKFSIVEKVTEAFKKKYDVVTVDGARVQFGDGWGLIRASNTEPALIMRFEAKTQERVEEIEKIIKGELAKFPSIAGELK